jgi:hypothetical protein
MIALKSSPDHPMFGKQLIEAHSAHLCDVFLQKHHEQETAKLEVLLWGFSVLVLALGTGVEVSQDIELFLLLLEVLVAEIRAEIVLDVSSANHTHQLQHVLLLNALPLL